MESSDLSYQAEVRGDVDMLIAAGWVRESLGTSLYRTRSEYDACNRRQLLQAATDTTASVLASGQLKSLGGTRQQLAAVAMFQAAKRKYEADTRAIYDIALRSLDAWLDPLCPACDGRGFKGSFGTAKKLCQVCSGTTHRRARLHNTNPGHDFGKSLLVLMDRRADAVTRLMKQFLRREAV